MKQRLASLLATAGLIAGMAFVAVPAAVVVAATSDCTGVGNPVTWAPPNVNDVAGDCQVSGTFAVSGNITVTEKLHFLPGAHVDTSAAATSITVTTGDLVMDANSSISGGGQNITINVPKGNMTMHGQAGDDQCGYPALPSNTLGAQITSVQAVLATTISITVGDINATPPTGSFVMEPCSLVDVSNHIDTGGGQGPAGTIVILAGHDVDVDGQVLSESHESGNGNHGGGPISIRTSCELTISDTGVVSSKGQDPGADLVHLQGCDVTIDGLVQSTGAGHSIPHIPGPNHCDVHPHNPAGSDTGCIEIWAEELVISSTGEVNADVSSAPSGGPEGTSYIDLFADKEITVTGKTGPTDHFSVHADSIIGTDHTPNVITALSHTSTITATDKAFSATNVANGSWGGTIDLEASGKVSLDTATVQAAGHNASAPNPPCSGGAGACGAGGHIIVKSWIDELSWASGVGNVSPDIPGALTSGTIALTYCTTITLGASFGNAIPTQTQTPGPCPAGPPLPSWVETAFAGVPGTTGDREIWARCNGSTKSGMKWNDLNGDGVKDAGEPGLGNWPINLTGPVNQSTTTSNVPATLGNYSFTITTPGTYTVCEGVSPVDPATWVQTFPNASTLSPNAQGETIIGTCTGPNKWGYQFTIAAGDNLIDNDFGNWQPPTKSGVKWKDVNGDGDRDLPGDIGLGGWTIRALDPANGNAIVAQDITSAVDGSYKLTFPKAGIFNVCEVSQGGLTQSFPNTAGAPSNDQVVLNLCPTPTYGPHGYKVTVQGGVFLSNNDFGNKPPPFECPEDPGRAAQITRTVGKPGAPVPNYDTLQQAYNEALSSGVPETIGMFSKTNENVVLGGDKALTITQCTNAQITAVNANSPVWTLSNMKKLTIIGPDSVGGSVGWLLTTGGHELKSIRSNGASEAGVKIADGSNGNNISFNNVASQGIGVWVFGDNNILKSGTIGPKDPVKITGTGVLFAASASGNKISGAKIQGNTGNGIQIDGNGNSVESNDILSNTINGVLITGQSTCPPNPCPIAGTGNTIKGNQIDSNGSDGVNVTGRNNTLQDNKVSKNKAHGFEISGTGNTLKGNASNNGSSGGSSENALKEYRFVGVSISTGGGSNKKDGATFTVTAAGDYE